MNASSIKIIGLVLYVSRFIYWLITERQANIAKPKTVHASIENKIGKACTLSVDALIVSQLCGVTVLPVPGDTTGLQLIGLLVVITGVSICFIARVTIGVNWAHGVEYQVKKQQELVTTGIYRYIRHPIYLGFFLGYIGAEMVAQSYLYISFFAFIFVMYKQGKREETLLLSHFGKPYQEYLQHSAMFIPFLW